MDPALAASPFGVGRSILASHDSQLADHLGGTNLVPVSAGGLADPNI